MDAYVPPHLRGKAPTDTAPNSDRHTTVFEEAVPAYVRKAGLTSYVGPSICGNGTGVRGIGLVGRPHLKFAQPQCLIQGIFRVCSPDDSFTIALQCSNEYKNSEWGSPKTGYHFCIGSQKPFPNSICVTRSTDNAEFPMCVVAPLSDEFSLSVGSRIRFQLELTRLPSPSNGETVKFSVCQLRSGDDDVYSSCASLLAFLPMTDPAHSTAVIKNREGGRLVSLEHLSLDGRNVTADLEELLSVDGVGSPVGVAGVAGARPRALSVQALAEAMAAPPPALRTHLFEVDFKGGMGHRTTIE
jgi:hypothetical protein